MTLADVVAGIIFAALNVYALLGGADFGGGVWDLLATGPRKQRQRELIADAVGPVWEANHVWLILALVLLFTCFPTAFARLGTLLHIPLSLVLIGIVLRGSAFTFWRYGGHGDEEQRRWGVVFAVASLITPLLLGTTVGAIASGALGEAGSAKGEGFVGTYVAPWLNPFALSVGLFALVAFAFLAAVYLTLEARERELQEDFRRRVVRRRRARAAPLPALRAACPRGADLRRAGRAAPRPDGGRRAHRARGALAAALAPGSPCRRRAGVAHSVGLGAGPVPLRPPSRLDHRGRRGAGCDAATGARRSDARRGGAAAVAGVLVSSVQWKF